MGSFLSRHTASGSPSENVSKLLWKDFGVVMLRSLDSSYQPLRTLKLTKRLDTRPSVEVWKEVPLSAFQLKTPQLKLPKVEPKRRQQRIMRELQDHTGLAAQLKLAVEASFGIDSSKTDSYDLEFYSEGVLLGNLQGYIDQCQPSHDWLRLTDDSKGLFGRYRTCGVVQEVWYAKHVEALAGHNLAVEGNLQVPAEIIAGAVVPSTAAGDVGAGFKVDVGTQRKNIVEANGFLPFAFKFILVSCTDDDKWVFKNDPSKRPRPMTVEPPAAEPWAFEDCPEVVPGMQGCPSVQ